MILKKLPKFTFFETFDQKSTSKLQKLTASVLYCSLKPPGYILDLITYLFTNLFVMIQLYIHLCSVIYATIQI